MTEPDEPPDPGWIFVAGRCIRPSCDQPFVVQLRPHEPAYIATETCSAACSKVMWRRRRMAKRQPEPSGFPAWDRLSGEEQAAIQLMCRDKLRAGGAGATAMVARLTASTGGVDIQAYRCPLCRRWHVGKGSGAGWPFDRDQLAENLRRQLVAAGQLRTFLHDWDPQRSGRRRSRRAYWRT